MVNAERYQRLINRIFLEVENKNYIKHAIIVEIEERPNIRLTLKDLKGLKALKAKKLKTNC